jgi:UDP-N-acetylglucosamine--N-acetylmuramyl-(pentapeptide) pyrophosphoryl-undecaprenol N-acetylglucosamine transferase
MAKRSLRSDRPDVLFSTGGYSAGPVVGAARSLGIPYVVHSADSVPPRSSAMFADKAVAFTTVFRSTSHFYKARAVTRTGHPIRKEMREASVSPSEGPPLILVLGGSQGSEFLNQTVPQAMTSGRVSAKVIHAAGPSHADKTQARVRELGLGPDYQVTAYLNTAALVSAFREASLVVARSGGTLAEVAVFGLPSVLIPLPKSANDHQFQNAVEFESMDAATILCQPSDLREGRGTADPAGLAMALADWIQGGARRERARLNLAEWDIADSAQRILSILERANSHHAETL